MMRTKLVRSLHVGLGVALLATGAAAVQACSVTVKSQTKYTASSPVTTQSTGTFNGETIRIANQNGDVIVNGDPNATSISVSTVPFAFADTQDDATAAIADVQQQIKIDQNQAGIISVTCAVAVQDHGTAKNGTTGCDNFTVTVPAGTAQAPLLITAHALNGSLTATGLNMSDQQGGQLHSDNGDVTVSVNGSVQADSANGQVAATVTPNKGSVVEASSGNGDVTLSLPASFSCDSLSLQPAGPGAAVNIASGFSNAFTAASKSVGPAGSGAASVAVTTQNGSITVQPH